MHRFFVPPGAIQNQQVLFTPEQGRQIRTVLRLRAGDEVVVLDGAGWCYRVGLEHTGKDVTKGHILDRTPAGGEPAGDIILCQAIARGERFEWVLQKGVELGVTHFQPMITERTVRRSLGESQRARWQRIVSEAAEQSGRGRIPVLAPEITFAEALSRRQGLALLPSTTAVTPVRQLLSQVAWPVSLYVGPEGGFAPREVALAQQAGVTPIGLGPRTLRTETAAVVMLALVGAALGEMDRPAPLAAGSW